MFPFFRAMDLEQGLKEHFGRHFQYSMMAFEELQQGNDPGLLFKHKNWVFREMMDGHELIKSHNLLFHRFKYNDPGLDAVRYLFKELRKIQQVFNGEWAGTFSMEDSNPIKREWKDRLSLYRTVFVEAAIDLWIEAFPGLQITENAVVREKLKLGEKKQMAFAYYIGKMVKEGIIVPPYNRDAQGKKVVNYSELARRLSMLFELPADLKNVITHLNPDKNTLSGVQKEQIDQEFQS
ncbi:MAG: hypothetical protein KG003_09480 [Bacteroidetes bacterium]|nr:hypothetical protein [Bacteroidota bacterium]